MEVVTFYSYKGGTEKSAAVKYVAEQLSAQGFSSFIIDFDLEAPVMHYQFADKAAKAEQETKSGLVEYIDDFFVNNNKEKLPVNFSDYYYTLPANEKRKAAIWFMQAGNQSDKYWSKFANIDWKKDFLLRDFSDSKNRYGTHLLIDMKARIKKELNPDFILIDSPSGIGDITTLTLRILPNKIVVIGYESRESLDGSETVLSCINTPENIWANKPKELFFALDCALGRLPELPEIATIKNRFDKIIGLTGKSVGISSHDGCVSKLTDLIVPNQKLPTE